MRRTSDADLAYERTNANVGYETQAMYFYDT